MIAFSWSGAASACAAALGVALCTMLVAVSPASAAPWDDPARTYPSSYDLRDRGRVTGVRDQSGYATCWVMSAMGSLESCLLPGSRLNLSENHLANHQSSRLNYQGRATNRISTAYVARWEGPVLERDDRYPRPGQSPEGLRPVRHVQNVFHLPPRSGPRDNGPLKWAITTRGAVSAAMAYQSWSINRATKAHYTTSTKLTHHVSVVGWNDKYPASRFLRRPAGNGAFLIKNSWGPQWGLKGYFWVSYYDAGFASEAAVFDGIESRSNYDAIYQHDPMAWTRTLGYGSDTAWFANRFLCAGSGTVRAVAFYAPMPDSSYEVRVADSTGALVSATAVASGSFGVGGYRTVRLKEPVAVTVGQRFVVAVRLTTPGWVRPIAIEHPSSLTSPRAAAGQSFVSADGAAWRDLTTMSGFSKSNVCLKAFVDGGQARDTKPPKVTLQSDVARVKGTANLRYTLTDPPFSSASAVVKLWVRTSSGRVVKKTRRPAVQVGETRNWRFGIKLARGTYRVEARAFDVAGNRQTSLSKARLTVR